MLKIKHEFWAKYYPHWFFNSSLCVGYALNLIITALQFTTVQLKLYSSDAANTLLVNFFKGQNTDFLFHGHKWWPHSLSIFSKDIIYNFSLPWGFQKSINPIDSALEKSQKILFLQNCPPFGNILNSSFCKHLYFDSTNWFNNKNIVLYEVMWGQFWKFWNF